MSTIHKSRGFTLMELIVVIVILALLILMAGPQLLKLLENGKQGTFRDEVLRMVDSAETAFTSLSLKPNSGITVSGTDKYLCLSLKELVDGGYLQKELNDSNGNAVWQGWIEITVPINGGNATYTATVTNGEYYVQSVKSNAVNDTELQGGNGITAPNGCKSGA